MNDKLNNLIPGGHKLTLEEQSRGGKRSGEVRKEKATMKKTLEMLLDTVPKSESNPEGKTFRQLTTEGLMIGATQGKAENYKLMLQLLGEMENDISTTTPEVKIEIVDHSNLEKQMYEEKDI